MFAVPFSLILQKDFPFAGFGFVIVISSRIDTAIAKIINLGKKMWPGTELDCRHRGFQSPALQLPNLSKSILYKRLSYIAYLIVDDITMRGKYFRY